MRRFRIQIQFLTVLTILAAASYRPVAADDGYKLRPTERRQEDRRVEERRSEERQRQEEQHRLERERRERNRLERERNERIELSRQDRERQESNERHRIDRETAEHNLFDGRLPHGFRDSGEFNSFVRRMNSELIKAGCPEVEAFFQGSSVTGRKFEESTGGYSGPAFDVGRVSDFDIALCSKRLFENARLASLEIRSDARTEPLDGRFVQRKLGLDQASRNLERLAGRKVNFMIYESSQAAIQRGPSIPVHRNRN